jgi:hypothetical protein
MSAIVCGEPAYSEEEMPKIKIDAIWREGAHLDDVKEGIRTLRWLISNTQSGKTIWHLMREVEMGASDGEWLAIPHPSAEIKYYGPVPDDGVVNIADPS